MSTDIDTICIGRECVTPRSANRIESPITGKAAPLPGANTAMSAEAAVIHHSDESDEALAARFKRAAVPLIPQLHGGARRMTRSRADAEDLVQETMLKAYVQFRTFRPGTYLKAWLFRIMYTTWIDGCRHARRRPPELLGAEISDIELAMCPRQASVGPIGLRSVEVEALDGLWDRRIPEAAMKTLREDVRKVVYYACVEGQRYQDIAQIMDIPLGTVTSRLYRARKQLQAELADLAKERGFGRVQRSMVAV